MKRSEYERRRRALEEQLRAALEMVQAGHEVRLRALEELWAETAEEDGVSSTAPVPSKGGDRRRKEVPERRAPAAMPPPAPSEPERRPSGQARADIESVLPAVPEVFEKGDLVRAIGYEPSRATMQRVLDQLLLTRRIQIAKASDGRRPTQYRKIPSP